MKVKRIKWVDSSIENTQVWPEDFPEPAMIESVGYLVRETDEYVILARDKMGNGGYRGLICIPKTAIK